MPKFPSIFRWTELNIYVIVNVPFYVFPVADESTNNLLLHDRIFILASNVDESA